MLKRIHVNQHVIRRNARSGERQPPIRIKTYRTNVSADRARIEGPSAVVYRPERPLPCGARLWIETEAPVYIEREGVTELIP